MKKPLLIFIIKCTVIIYIIVFTNIQDLTTAKSVPPIITRPIWKLNPDIHIDYLFVGSGQLAVSSWSR